MAIQIDVVVVVIDRVYEKSHFIHFVGMLVGSCFKHPGKSECVSDLCDFLTRTSIVQSKSLTTPPIRTTKDVSPCVLRVFNTATTFSSYNPDNKSGSPRVDESPRQEEVSRVLRVPPSKS